MIQAKLHDLSKGLRVIVRTYDGNPTLGTVVGLPKHATEEAFVCLDGPGPDGCPPRPQLVFLDRVYLLGGPRRNGVGA